MNFKLKVFFLSIFCVSLASSPLQAQTIQQDDEIRSHVRCGQGARCLPPRPPRPPFIPQPRIIVPQDKQPIQWRDLHVEVAVTGNVALTTYDMTFFNPNSMVLEGEFVFPLAEDQNVSALALDINGELREGVVVGKEKARQTFEAIVRQGIDPAIVEKTAGNQFKTRIYPFNPGSTRRVRVTVEEPLSTKDNAYLYQLPLQMKETLQAFSIVVEIPEESVASIPKMDTDLSNFAFSSVQKVWRAKFEQNNYELNNKITFLLPKKDKEPVFTHQQGSETFFYADVAVQGALRDKKLPTKLAIVWDTSLSGGRRDLAREKRLLGAYLKKIGNADVTLLSFHITTDIKKKFSIKGGNWNALEAAIDALAYDGGTRFDGIDLKGISADEILLFSDGVSTFGNSVLAQVPAPLFAISSATEYNRGALTHLANSSGGGFINLSRMSDEAALVRLSEQPLKLLSYSFDKNKIKEVYPAVGADIDQNLTLVGILTGTGTAEISVTFGFDKNSVVATKKLKIQSGGDNPAVARLWAQQKIKVLEGESEKNEEAIVQLGKAYSLVTEFTSLIVLERLEDYVQHEIVPPQSLRKQYDQIMANIQKAKKSTLDDNLREAVHQVNVIKQWWSREFDQKAPQKQKEKGSVGSGGLGLRGVGSGGGGLAGAVASPAPPAAAPEESERRTESPRARQAQRRSLSSFGDAQMQESVSADLSTDGIAASKMMQGESTPTRTASVQVKAWDPQTPYMKILKNSKNEELYADYLKIKSGYDEQPSFYFDVADVFMQRKQADRALLVLSNIAELKLDNVELLRTAANKLMEIQQYAYAVDLFERIVKLRSEDPQPYRDLALALQASGQHQRALETFYKVLSGKWDGRFKGIKQIIFVEMNNLIALAPKLDLSDIAPELIFPVPVEIRIVLGWSTDNTDIDLHIHDPYGEHVYYSHKESRIGGRISDDLTQGFGPEEFMIKNAVPGEYKISTNNFGDSRQSLSGPTVLYLDIYTFYGTKQQTHQRVLVRTENVKDNNVIGTVDFILKQ